MNRTRSEAGFTLVESLFQLIIALAFLHLIVLFLLFKDSTHQRLTDSLSTEWELFMVDLQTDLAEIQTIEVKQNGTMLIAHKPLASEDTEYTNVGGVIRRRVDGQGHVPLLTSVKDVQFIDEGPLLQVLVTLSDGTERQRRIAVGLFE